MMLFDTTLLHDTFFLFRVLKLLPSSVPLRFLLDVKRADVGAKLLMRFGKSIIDRYNALPQEERDTSSIIGHLIRMQAPHENARLADVVGASCIAMPSS